MCIYNDKKMRSLNVVYFTLGTNMGGQEKAGEHQLSLC